MLIKIHEDQFREAEASGTINNEDLGESRQETCFQTEHITCITTGERTCDDGIEEE
jgi:hypothetical protein